MVAEELHKSQKRTEVAQIGRGRPICDSLHLFLCNIHPTCSYFMAKEGYGGLQEATLT